MVARLALTFRVVAMSAQPLKVQRIETKRIVFAADGRDVIEHEGRDDVSTLGTDAVPCLWGVREACSTEARSRYLEADALLQVPGSEALPGGVITTGMAGEAPTVPVLLALLLSDWSGVLRARASIVGAAKLARTREGGWTHSATLRRAQTRRRRTGIAR